jgi:hypothetical protein
MTASAKAKKSFIISQDEEVRELRKAKLAPRVQSMRL